MLLNILKCTDGPTIKIVLPPNEKLSFRLFNIRYSFTKQVSFKALFIKDLDTL